MANADFVIYTLGDTQTFEGMLQGVALIFQDPFYSGGAAFGLGYGVLLGALILLTIAIYQAAFNQKLDFTMLIAPLIFYTLLTMPKVTVTVVDAYNQAPVKQVANIPIGLAFPLNIASSVAQSFSESMEQAYSTPSSPRMLVDGFASPLRNLYALRYVNISEESPYIANMTNQIYKSCIVGNTKFDPDEYKNSPDSYTYFINFLYNNGAGLVTLRNIDGSFATYSCYDAASKLQTAFEAFVFGTGATAGTLNYNFKRALNGALLLTDGSGKVTKTKDYNDIMTSFAQITDLSTNDGRQFLLNTLFNQPLQSASLCASNIGSTESKLNNMGHCMAWIQGDEQLAEDNAAAATGFMRVLQDGQNILIILAILLFPMVVLMIVYMGKKSLMIVSSYVMYIASVYLWMPMATIINFYSYSKIKNTIYSFSGSNTGDLFAISDYPAFYQAISDSLSLANGLTAILPAFCMMFFSGLTMAMVGFMRRMDATKTSYYDAKLNAPDALSPSPFMNRTSMASSQGLGSMTDSNGGKAFTSSSSQSFDASASQMIALQKQKKDLESKSENLTAQINSLTSTSVNGGVSDTKLSNVNDSNKKDIISGTGFNQQSTEGNSGTYTKDAKSLQLKGNENDLVNITNQIGINTGVGLGLKVGKGNTIAPTMLPADGTPAALQNATTDKVVAKGSGDNTYSLFFVQAKGGSAVISQAGYRDSDQHEKTATEKNALYTGSANENKAYQDSNYLITGGHQENLTHNGISHKLENSTTTGSGDTVKKDNAYKVALSDALSQTQAELEQVNRAIAQVASTGLTVNMLDSDIMHRIIRHESIRNDLEKIDRENKERFGDKWEEAKKVAAMQAELTGLSVSKIANAEEFAYYQIVVAGMSINYESASGVYKALTGLEAPVYDLNKNLDSANTDWAAMNLDHSNLSGKFNKHFGSSIGLDGQYAYLAGELEVRGDKQQRNMIQVYNAFLHAGFTPKQAAILTAEVGRENSFNSSSLFGTHYDPEKKHITNGGMISFNQDRKMELDREMMEKGLVAKGKIGTASYIEGQASLDAMAQFMHKELSTNKRYSASWDALNSDKSIDQIHYTVGKNYIVWRIDDEKYRESGESNRKEFASRLSEELLSQSKAKLIPTAMSGLSSIDLIATKNPSLTEALLKTGLKGQILGDGLVDNKFISQTGLPIKAPSHNKDQAYGGGESRGYTVEFAHLVHQQLGRKVAYFSGFNDEYHKEVGSTGKHVEGKAFDLVLSNPNEAKKAIAEMQALAKQHGYKVAFVNEYEGRSKDFTGQHLHVSVLGREAYKNKIAQELENRFIAAESGLNSADLTRTQKTKPVKQDVGSYIPSNEVYGAGHKANTTSSLNASYGQGSQELKKSFDKTTLATQGIIVTPDKNGEDLHYSVKDTGKLAENLYAPIVTGKEAWNNLKDNAGNVIERNKTLPADLHLDREMYRPKDESKVPQYSDFNLNRQNSLKEVAKQNDTKLEAATELNRQQTTRDARQVTANNDATEEKLEKLLENKSQQVEERKSTSITDAIDRYNARNSETAKGRE